MEVALTPTATANARQHLRRPLRTSGVLRHNGVDQYVRTLDISNGGMAIIVNLNPPLGTSCFAYFQLMIANRGFVRLGLNCRVANSVYCHRHRGFQLGLAFDRLPDVASHFIEQYITAKDAGM